MKSLIFTNTREYSISSPEKAALYDALTGALAGLAKAAEGKDDLPEGCLDLVTESLAAPFLEYEPDLNEVQNMINMAHDFKRTLSPSVRISDLNMDTIYDIHSSENELRIRTLALLRSCAQLRKEKKLPDAEDKKLGEFLMEYLRRFASSDEMSYVKEVFKDAGETSEEFFNAAKEQE